MDESQNNSRQHPSFVAEHKISYNIKCFSKCFFILDIFGFEYIPKLGKVV